MTFDEPMLTVRNTLSSRNMHCIARRFYSIGRFKLGTSINTSFEQEIKQFLGDGRKIGEHEWCKLRANLLKNAPNRPRVDNIILKHFEGLPSTSQRLAYTKQYLKALPALNIQPTVTNYNHLVRSYCSKNEEQQLTREEQTGLLETCEMIIKKSEMFLPTPILDNIVHGLCCTVQWKRSLSIMNETNDFSRGAKTTVAEKAFREGELDLGFQLLDEIVTDGYEIAQKVCTAYWAFCRQNGEQYYVENVERMLRYLGSKNALLTKTCLQQLHDMINEFGSNASYTRVDRRGKCYSCRNMLEMEVLPEKDFEQLKEAIMQIALIGDNAFLKTTPDEVKKFTKFIEKTAPYDIVLDGLNVAFRTYAHPTNREKADTLASVVTHLADRKLRVLIIGREHMNEWPRKTMNYIRENSIFFAVQNSSNDDLFTLYAALYSGPNTRVLTCDLMRSHSCLLGFELKSIFKRWQQTNLSRIIYVNPGGNIAYMNPIEHKLCCHKSNGHWHIPYLNDEDFNMNINERIRIEKLQWSCLKLKDPNSGSVQGNVKHDC